MVSTKFSPGPWIIIRNQNSERKPIERIGPLVGANCADYGEIAISGPDARLISAAPDLYTALEKLVSIVHGNTKNELASAMDESIAALDKASGL